MVGLHVHMQVRKSQKLRILPINKWEERLWYSLCKSLGTALNITTEKVHAPNTMSNILQVLLVWGASPR